MISDEERREVARRLREMGEELGSSVLLWYYIAKILGVRTATDGKTACDMLADLIEPSEPEDFYRVTYSRSTGGSPYMLKVHSAKGDEWDFWRIDRDALLTLADEMTVEKGDIWRWSSRIREALGVDK